MLLAGASALLSFVGKNTSTEGLTVGDKAPSFVLGTDGDIALKDLRGRRVLLSFWASYDAPSRMRNAALDRAVCESEGVEMVSVSFDEYRSVFRETVRQDGLSADRLFVETAGTDSDLYRAYRLKRGFTSYLIDENGIIVARDVTPSQLAGYMN